MKRARDLIAAGIILATFLYVGARVIQDLMEKPLPAPKLRPVIVSPITDEETE